MSSSHFPPKTRPLIGLTAGLTNQRPGFWREMAGISQSQIKGDYNFNNRQLSGPSFTILWLGNPKSQLGLQPSQF